MYLTFLLQMSNEEDQTFQTPSLYVGDLAPDISESSLFEVFSAVGPVASIRVCRDAATRRSLGYAYVNFHQLADAERALDTMNYSLIKGRACRIMWSQRDPSLRKSGVGNIFVKNLNPAIDHKGLYDTFSLFGNILSCKVVTDRETGASKGYGYIHYETAQAAQAAIDKLDGMHIDGQQVQVGHFMRRDNRPTEWTNCYVKNIPYEWSDTKLEEEFAKFGDVLSASVAVGIRKNHTEETEEKQEPQTLGYGFVNFATHEGAQAAVEALNGTMVKTAGPDGEEVEQELYVGRAQKKTERERELRAKFEAEKMDRISKFQGVNLYVKNLDESVTDQLLRDEFAAMGTVTSARVMRDKDGSSRGFGFCCFSTPEEATRAVNEMNGKLLEGKPIFVALAQRREVRRAQLEAQHAGRAGRFPMMPMYGRMPYPVMPMPPPPRGARFPVMPGRYPVYQTMPARGGRGGPQVKFNPQARNAMPQPQQPPPPQQQQSLTASALASASPEVQKNMIGERLYPMIYESQPELAGKITGMLLEMDNSELLHLLESPEALQAKIAEALGVLEAHQAGQEP